MKPSRELTAMIVAGIVAAAILIGFMLWESPTTPVQRSPDQNQGGNAPFETQPPPDGGRPVDQADE